MPLSRLLAIALLVPPLSAFGQSKSNDTLSTTQTPMLAVASEPSQILPTDFSKLVWPTDLSSKPQVHPSQTLSKGQDQGIILEDVPRTAPDNNSVVLLPKNFVASPGETFLGATCFTMRSYVVARDSKDSDSTHLVHYSTCQPSSRYRVKTIELQPPTSK